MWSCTGSCDVSYTTIMYIVNQLKLTLATISHWSFQNRYGCSSIRFENLQIYELISVESKILTLQLFPVIVSHLSAFKQVWFSFHPEAICRKPLLRHIFQMCCIHVQGMLLKSQIISADPTCLLLENSTFGIRPISEYLNEIYCLHDLYQIQNIVIFGITGEYQSACKHSHQYGGSLTIEKLSAKIKQHQIYGSSAACA